MIYNDKILKISLLLTPMFVIGIGTLLYACRFAKNGTSNDPAVWGQFGDYINFWVSIASLIVVSALTYILHKSEQRRNTEHKNFQDTLERPILVFVDEGLERRWKVKNIGRGAAMNLLVAHYYSDSRYENVVKSFSLGAGEELRLTWQLSAYIWVVSYKDIFGISYTATCKGDETSIQDGNSLSFIPKEEYKRLSAMKNIVDDSSAGR